MTYYYPAIIRKKDEGYRVDELPQADTLRRYRTERRRREDHACLPHAKRRVG